MLDPLNVGCRGRQAAFETPPDARHAIAEDPSGNAARRLRQLAGVAACTLAVIAGASSPRADLGASDLQVEIQEPAPDLVVPSQQRSLDVRGSASIPAGVGMLDLFLVMDTSKSLRRTDPDDHRIAGAVGLVKLLLWTNTHIGVVDFDKEAELVSPLTGDRTAVMKALRALDQQGKTDLARGIRTALEGFRQGGRPGALRLMLVFTDGRSSQDAVREAMVEARDQGVSISTLMLGSDESGESMLRELADATGGSFVAVRDPAELPDAFRSLRTGVQSVSLQVNDGEPVAAELAGTRFHAQLPLEPGDNRIVARATAVDGRQLETLRTVTVRAPGCAELLVRAERNGRPALSLSDRTVEIVVDASGSMWGRIGGRTKIEIARQTLEDALADLPPDLRLSLRAYGHQHDREENDCQDTELLVAPDTGNRDEIRRAIAELQPRGQTPLGYALSQVAADFGSFAGERAVVLVTDGLESCGGDAPAEARALQAQGSVPVHVIGFGLSGSGDEDLASLRAIADASGGRFLTAGSADELRRALGTTVGTPFRILRGEDRVASGTIGAEEALRLAPGDYRLVLDGTPPRESALRVPGEQRTTLLLSRDGAEVRQRATGVPIEYSSCEPDPAP